MQGQERSDGQTLRARAFRVTLRWAPFCAVGGAAAGASVGGAAGALFVGALSLFMLAAAGFGAYVFVRRRR